jgi:uncharacterized membrane protein YtjA (UPF0391 family)
MFKYAVFFLVLSLIAGALGLTNVSRVAKLFLSSFSRCSSWYSSP